MLCSFLLLLVIILGWVLFRSKSRIFHNSNSVQVQNEDNQQIFDETLSKTLDFKSTKVNFKVGYPASWSSCKDEVNQIQYESSVIATIQSLADKCFLGFAMDREYQNSDVHIDFLYYYSTEKDLETWVNKRTAENGKNGLDYTVQKKKDGFVASLVDNNYKFDSLRTFRLESYFVSTPKYILEMKVFILEQNYKKYQSVLDKMVDSVEVY